MAFIMSIKLTKTIRPSRVKPTDPRTKATECAAEAKQPGAQYVHSSFPAEPIPCTASCLARRDALNFMIASNELSLKKLYCERDIVQRRLQFRQNELEAAVYGNKGDCSISCR
jgi:hypothetical protein